MQASDSEHHLQIFTRYIELERRRSDVEGASGSTTFEAGVAHLQSAKFLTAHAAVVQRLTGIKNPFRVAARYAGSAAGFFRPTENEIDYLVDACLEVSSANWYIKDVSFEVSLSWCDKALRYASQFQSHSVAGDPGLAFKVFTAKKNRGLFLLYLDRCQESAAQYRALLGDSVVDQYEGERFTLSVQLANVLLDSYQITEAMQLLDECRTGELARTNDQKLRLASSQSLAYSRLGDMNRAIAYIHKALMVFYDDDESLSLRGNLLLRSARFSMLVGDTETALATMSDIEHLSVVPAGALFDLNKLTVEAMAADDSADPDQAREALNALDMALAEVEQGGISEYRILYFQLMAEIKARRNGPQPAVQYLEAQTPVAGLTLDTLEREWCVLLLTYGELLVSLPALSVKLHSLVPLLLRGLGYIDKWYRWRVLSLAASYDARRGRLTDAVLWSKRACLEISTLRAPLFSSAAQRRRLSSRLVHPFEVLEHHLVASARLPEAHVVRGGRRRLASYWRYPALREIDWQFGSEATELVALTGAERQQTEQWDRACDAVSGKLLDGHPLPDALQESVYAEIIDSWVRPVAPDNQLRPVTRKSLSPGMEGSRLDYWSDGVNLMASVTTATRSETIPLSISVSRLRSLVYECRHKIIEKDNWHSCAGQLYKQLIAPLERWLDTGQALSITVCDVLRYLPFAALHDGSRFLVEHLPISYQYRFSPVTEPDVRDCSVLFLGTNDYGSGGRRLMADRERSEIARTFPIRRALTDRQLDGLSLAGALPRAPGIVHVCNHYDHVSHQPDQSRLLLSDGRQLSLQELFDDSMNWRGVGFLFLGICNSGLSGAGVDTTDSESGSSLSLAELFLSSGVGAVVATFSPVEDTDNINFSASLYKHLRSTGRVSLALRQAQIEAIADHSHHWPLYGLWR